MRIWRVSWLFMFWLSVSQAQPPDSSSIDTTGMLRSSSPPQTQADTTATPVPLRSSDITRDHPFYNVTSPPVPAFRQNRNHPDGDGMFYAILFLFFLFGLLRAAFGKYFTNMVRVFFNTSLRQSQLTDQLLIARLPSLLYNALFTMVAGFFSYLLLQGTTLVGAEAYLTLAFCILFFAALYIGKYLFLGFAGWVMGYRSQAQSYLFVVFLINKISAIPLLFSLPLLAFASPEIAYGVKVVTLTILGLLLLFRLIRAYELFVKDLRPDRLHFLLFVLSFELIPFLLMAKWALAVLNKNL